MKKTSSLFRKVLSGLLFFCTLVFGTTPLQANDLSKINVVTSYFPPFSFEEDGQVKGIAVDRAEQIFAHLNISPKINIYPWARAYTIAEKTPNTLIFSMARTDKREKAFKWVGEIVGFDVHLYRRADRGDIKIGSFDDLNKYQVVGLLKDVKTSYLKARGISVTGIRSENLGINMLIRGRADLMASDRNSMDYRIKQLGIKPNTLIPIFPLHELSKPLYAAFNKETDDKIIEKFREALEYFSTN